MSTGGWTAVQLKAALKNWHLTLTFNNLTVTGDGRTLPHIPKAKNTTKTEVYLSLDLDKEAQQLKYLSHM